jgi:hypothetical protein
MAAAKASARGWPHTRQTPKHREGQRRGVGLRDPTPPRKTLSRSDVLSACLARSPRGNHSYRVLAVAARAAGLWPASNFSRCSTGVRQGLLCERLHLPSLSLYPTLKTKGPSKGLYGSSRYPSAGHFPTFQLTPSVRFAHRIFNFRLKSAETSRDRGTRSIGCEVGSGARRWLQAR